MTAWRDACATTPYTTKTANVIVMNTPLNVSSWARGDVALGSTNCGRNAKTTNPA
jgi:hypothetical protein